MSLYGGLAEAERGGKEVVVGSTAVTASVDIDTPFANIDHVDIGHNTDTAPGVGSSHFTWTASGNTVTIYAWKPTGSADTTLVAGTVETTVSYTIIGRRR